MSKEWDKDKAINMADTRIITYSGNTLCDNYRKPLEYCETAAQAIRLYKNCISWALLERYPTKGDLLAIIPKETLAKNGVYVDMKFNGERIDGHICCVFLNCTGCISTGLNLEKKIIPMLYLSEGSQMEIDADENIIDGAIPVELYYDSMVYIKTKDRCKVRIKDCNRQSVKDNVGFAPEDAGMNPDMDNEML